MPPPDEVQRKAAEIVARPEYHLDDETSTAALELWGRLLSWIFVPLRWLYHLLDGLPEVFRWPIVIVLVLVCLALIAHIVWTFLSAIRPSDRTRFTSVASEREATPEEMEKAAEAERLGGNYIGAIRCLFVACLLRIQRAEKKRIRKGITNRELLRRYQSSPLSQPLQYFVDVIDTKWYGREDCFESDFELCRSQYAMICSYVERPTHVAGS
ncbi:hypothetical protein SH661x_003204 [Planctomicrobium sp. SH661]|uniref:hypothetical protein n=1 Tax=Planctomicrobium sp. SH661 TaxID=3448124 RepID=UPI003F5BDCA6